MMWGSTMLLFCGCLFIFIGSASGQVVKDMAQGKNTFQSSTYHLYGWSYLAVDGSENPDYYTKSCTATNSDNQAWWTVDLIVPSTIHYVELLNRADCCPERLSNFKILAMNSDHNPHEATDIVQCKHFTGTVQNGNSGFQRIDCDQRVVGRYLSIRLEGTNHLTLCEVRVFADVRSHYGPTWNYAEGQPVTITNDQERQFIPMRMSDYVTDSDYATCPNRLVSGNENGKLAITMAHEVAVKKVRVYQSPSCPYYCSTKIDLSGWSYEDPRDGCNSGGSDCWVRNAGIDYIIVNDTNTATEGSDARSRGWNVVVIDECGCTIKDRLEIDHFSDSQQVGCMDPNTSPTPFSPFINALEDGDIMIGVSEDEVQRGNAACYSQGLDALGVNTNFEYRAAVAFIAKKGYPEFTQTVIRSRGNGPAQLANLWIGAAPNHEFSAGFVAQPLDNDYISNYQTYHGLIGAGEVGVMEFDDPPIGTYFQLNFPTIGVHLCEVELFLGNMAEFCGDSGDTCWFIPSRKWDTTAEGEWECRAFSPSARLAEVSSAEFSTAQGQLTSDSDLSNVPGLMVGATSAPGFWRYVDSFTEVPSNVHNGQSGDILTIPRSGNAGSITSGAGDDYYVLCEMPKIIYEGTQHVVMRVKAGDDSQGSIFGTWTETSIIPNLDEPITVDHISYDINEGTFFKSPIIDCAWEYVKEVRFSFYNKDVEAGFMNFVVPSGTSKSEFFSSANLRGSAWNDMADHNTVSFGGYTSGSASRRFLFEKTSDSCSDSNTEEAWMMMLDTDHSACVDWDSDNTDLPAFLYSDTYPTVSTGYDMKPADLFIVAVTFEDGLFDGWCVSNCYGLPDGSYHSCIGCNVYVTCTDEAMEYFVCRASERWQSTGHGQGSCQATSTSCTERDAPATCNPNGCSSNPCYNGATCSMHANGGWQCACTDAWQGVDCNTEVDECLSDPCVHGSCTDHVGSFTCTCEAGYTDTTCSTNINECSSNPCQNGATCEDQVNGYRCACVAGYNGDHCETNIDECSPNPCQNNGACADGVNDYTCTCASGWAGAQCTSDIDECESNPCQNGGVCTDAVNGYTCQCRDGYEGDECQTDIDECAGNPCENNGVCTDRVNSFECACATGWSGPTCSSDVNECDSNPCVRGTCNDHVGSYTCTCDDGWTDTNCATNIDECSPNPCQHGGACTDGDNAYTCTCVAGYTGPSCATNIDECGSNPCRNDATCNDGVNEYSCTCASGWAGTHCSEDIDECASNPCQNGATCVDQVNGYRCDCVAGYEDAHCATNIDDCDPQPCQNDGTCIDLVDAYLCDCVPGWEGFECQTDTDDCYDDPCENGGNCTDRLNAFECACPEGTVGDTCMDDPCLPNPCLLGGACQVNTTDPRDYTPICTCIDGLEGDLCDEGPCEEDENYCANGGQCSNVMSGSGFSAEAVAECDCEGTGYEGDQCDEGDGTIGLVAHQQGNDDKDKGGVAAMIQQPIVLIAVAVVAGVLFLMIIVIVRRRMKKQDPEQEDKDAQESQQEAEAGRAQADRNTAWAGIGGTGGGAGAGAAGAGAAARRGPAPVARQAPSWDNDADEFML